jgi:hypothetical protein
MGMYIPSSAMAMPSVVDTIFYGVSSRNIKRRLDLKTANIKIAGILECGKLRKCFETSVKRRIIIRNSRALLYTIHQSI